MTADFSLFDLQCNVQDLTFQYQTTNGNTDYILYGGLSLSVSGNTISATLGTSTDPGLIIQNGVVDQINMAISGSFADLGVRVRRSTTPGSTTPRRTTST